MTDTTPCPPPLEDTPFAGELVSALDSYQELLLATRRGTTAAWTRRASKDPAWQWVGRGDFGMACAATVAGRRPKVTVRLARVEDEPSRMHPNAADALANPVSQADLRAWVAESLEACGLSSAKKGRGRTGTISARTQDEVIYRAAWRCQMEGCAEDLRSHLAATVAGNFSYLAHIVAASPDGPRGDPVRSAKLVDSPDNILLLCDKCHRLVDRVNPAAFPEPRLQAIREHSVAAVRRLLATLKFPEVRAVSIITSIAGQVHPPLARSEMDEALWSRGLRADERSPRPIFAVPRKLHDPHSAAYWQLAMRGVHSAILELRDLVDGTGADEQAPQQLAIFPLATTSVLVLAGRVLGDKPTVIVFQPDRNARGNRWLWPSAAASREPNTFTTTTDSPPASVREAALIVNLTFPISPDRLPVEGLPTVRIDAKRPGIDAIASAEDLAAFGRSVDDALRILQDEWKAEVIHLFIGAPASACIKVGQKLQARHHAIAVIYETEPVSKQFQETIRITRQAARHEPSGEIIDLIS